MDVGDWDGKEELAAENLNRISEKLFDAIHDDEDEQEIHNIMDRVFNDWGSEEKLLTITDKQIDEYVKKIV